LGHLWSHLLRKVQQGDRPDDDGHRPSWSLMIETHGT